MPKKPFTIPASFFKQLNEFTAGGFILYYINEYGELKAEPHFDNDAAALSLIRYAAMHSRSLESINEQITLENMNQELDNDIDEFQDPEDTV